MYVITEDWVLISLEYWSFNFLNTNLGTKNWPETMFPSFFSSFRYKVNPFKLTLPDLAKNITMVLLNSPIKIRGKSVKGFMSYDLADRQTDREIETTTFIYV